MPARSMLDTLRIKRDDLGERIARLAAKETLTRAEDDAWQRSVADYDRTVADIVKLEARAERIEHIERNTYRTHDGTPDLHERGDMTTVQGDALRSLDRLGKHFSPGAGDRQERLLRSDPGWAAEFSAAADPDYADAFGKYVRHGADASLYWNDLERAAWVRSTEARAMAEGATTQGGFAVPVFIDPSVILTNQELLNPYWQIGNVVDVQTNVWKGVSSAGVVFSFDPEGAEVSDDSVTLSQPSVTVFTARGFIPASIEVMDDWPGFQQEMSRLLAVGYDDLCIQKFTNGSGTAEPRGIITALDANTNVQFISTTDGSFGQEDVYGTWAKLPPKYRRNASWMMSTSANNRIRQMGAANVYHGVTVTLPAGAADQLFNRPVYVNDYFPDLANLTTWAQDRVVVGDFHEFVIARRAGMTIEIVPHLFGASGRPNLTRGMICWARVGSNTSVDTAFALQRNT